MNVKGKNPPRYTKKAPITSNTKAGSLNGAVKSLSFNFRLLGGRRDFMARFPKMRRLSMMKATTRIVQPKPIFGMRWLIMIGRTIPPRLEPDTMIPNARARCFENQVPTAAMATGCLVSQLWDVEILTYWEKRGNYIQ